MSLLFLLTISSETQAGSTDFPDLPTSRHELGNAFLTAWHRLRLDLDTLPRGDLHPGIIEKWLDSTPTFLLRDMAMLSHQPQFLLEAASRLAKQEGIVHLSLLKSMAEQRRDTPVGMEFAALRIIAGDNSYETSLSVALRSRSTELRMEAAAILAFAGKPSGMQVLRNEINACGSGIRTAARVLSRTGSKAEIALFEKAIRSGCDTGILTAAVGELHFAQRFPWFHMLLTHRDPSGVRSLSGEGLYAIWMMVYREAHRAEVRTPEALIRFVSGFRELDRLQSSLEVQVLRRYLDAFSDFLRDAEKRTHLPDHPPWPDTFTFAMKTLQHRNGIPESSLLSRVSAAIRLCAVLGDKLRYGQLPDSNFGILTTMGKRANDGNFATNWRAQQGDRMTLVWPFTADIRSLWIATGCMGQPKTAVTRILIDLHNGDPSREYTLPSETHYFSVLTMDARNVRRMTIEILETASAVPACISEVRVEHPYP